MEVLMLPEDIAEKNACKMEHVVGPQTIERFKRLLEFIQKENLIEPFSKFISDYDEIANNNIE